MITREWYRTLYKRPLPGGQWTWGRIPEWRRVCEVMDDAGLYGLHATPKGLR